MLVRKETSPDDIHGMHAAEGFLTATGGMTSHAAVVARQMGKVCVAGCEDVEVFEDEAKVRIGPSVFKEGDYLSINGFSGFVYGGMLSVVDSGSDPGTPRHASGCAIGQDPLFLHDPEMGG